MGKYRDGNGSGRAHVVYYRPNESWQDRHERRLALNLSAENMVRNWADLHEITLTISNEGQHWRFDKGSKVAEWWPSTARLVLHKQYQQGIHCHDYAQLMDLLIARWKLKPLRFIDGKLDR